jgi:geranylgeranyl pyrophosphate synthase
MLSHPKTISAEARRYDQLGLDSASSRKLMGRAEVNGLLGLEAGAAVRDVIQGALLEPIDALTSNSGKRIRARLVTLSYRLVARVNYASVTAANQCRTGAEVVELIHAGSLVVDDIEDGSQTRRGKPALHIRYGLPIALNAGNWLYFWPFQLIKDLQLPRSTILLLYEYCHRTLLRAHLGQALDLGSRVDKMLPDRVPEVCFKSMELKTGALMGFAVGLGALIARAKQRVVWIVDQFGCDLGVALQMYDDLGNLLGTREPSKKFEDLLLYRPSWAWACAAENTSAKEYDRFVSAVSELPNASALHGWIDRHKLCDMMRDGARRRLDLAFRRLEDGLQAERVQWSSRGFEELRALATEMAAAYG